MAALEYCLQPEPQSQHELGNVFLKFVSMGAGRKGQWECLCKLVDPSLSLQSALALLWCLCAYSCGLTLPAIFQESTGHGLCTVIRPWPAGSHARLLVSFCEPLGLSRPCSSDFPRPRALGQEFGNRLSSELLEVLWKHKSDCFSPLLELSLATLCQNKFPTSLQACHFLEPNPSPSYTISLLV